ncbi:hypothetical protein CBM2589_B200130 [Cupriavidus taiwanensis]|uniref:Uncharacterized protein n=1 Tax=Cupriavidus taiwanensis TaxID=164546 RepID=A0A975WXU8_9BURK|nr:hypothetical protein CBM2589_B200130 [Cupriavidus taiwanensis]
MRGEGEQLRTFRAEGFLPSPACGRGAGVRASVSTGGMLEKTEGFA